VWTETERAAFAGALSEERRGARDQRRPQLQLAANTPGTSSTWNSELRTKAGTLIPNSGIESYYAQTPVFSHDGKMLAFTDRSASRGTRACSRSWTTTR
jgi:hypothetical protein